MMIIKKKKNPTTQKAAKANLLFKRLPVPKQFSSLRAKLILSFIIPIAFIILLGLASYQMASSGIKNKYSDMAVQVVGKTAEYMDFGLETVENTALEYLNDDNVSQFLSNSNSDSNTYKMVQMMSSIQNSFIVKSAVDDFILNIYIIPDNENILSSRGSSAKLAGDTYKGILDSENGKQLIENSSSIIWSGSEPLIDEKLSINNSDYALRFIRKFMNHQALIMVDVNADTIKDIIDKTTLDDTGVLAFVTKDGKEIAKKIRTRCSFTNSPFIKRPWRRRTYRAPNM
jgi:methyl-accepting chemotaxis protein